MLERAKFMSCRRCCGKLFHTCGPAALELAYMTVWS